MHILKPNIFFETIKNLPKEEVKRSKLWLCFIYLASILISINSYFLRTQIINLDNSNHLLWLLLILIPSILIFIPALLFTFMKKLKWTYNFYTKYILLIFNIISLSIIFSVSLPIIFQGKTWFWIFFLPGLVTSLKILNIVFIKKESISLIVRWSAIISIGIIPLIFGVIFHQDILIAGCAWILVWEFTNEIWDIFIVKLLLKQKNRELSYYPLLPIILFIYLMGILIWLISNTFIDAVPSNPFKNDEDD